MSRTNTLAYLTTEKVLYTWEVLKINIVNKQCVILLFSVVDTIIFFVIINALAEFNNIEPCTSEVGGEERDCISLAYMEWVMTR